MTSQIERWARALGREMKADDINIPEPCAEDWDGMTPEERGRFCSACRKTVHDLSAMPERDAKALLASGADICVSYLSDASGAVQFIPEPPRLVPAARLVRRASATAAAGLSLALAACTPHGDGAKVDAQQVERAEFLEVHPTIPEVEPCESTPPGVSTEHEEEGEVIRMLGAPIAEHDLVRTKGDVAPPPQPEVRAPVRKTGKKKPKPKHNVTRTAGMPAR